MSVWTLLLVSVLPWIFTQALERVELTEDHALTCGQGIIHCEVESGGPTCIRDDEHVIVSSLDAYIVQCLTQETWSLCLKVLLTVTEPQAVSDEGSGDEEELHGSAPEEPENTTSAGTVRVCYTYTSQRHSRAIQFTFPSSALDDSTTLQVRMSLVVQIPKAELGGSVVVHSSYTNSTKLVIIPSKEEVCSKGLDAIFCKVAPRLLRRTDDSTGAIKLYVADADKWRSEEFNACQRLDRNRGCLKVEWTNASHEFEISQGSVAPCLCFEIWGNFPRTKYCPFLNETVSGSSVSVSLAEAETQHKRPALVWNLTASCRLEAQLWLCRKGSGRDRGCHYLNSRSRVQTRQNDSWIQTDCTHWQLQGEFLQVERHPLLCVQVKVVGMEGHVGPVCPFEVKRTHWSFPLMLCVMLVCLSVLAAYAVQGTLKSWVFRWLKVDDVNTAVGEGAELLLVCPPDADGAVIQLLCRLCSSLSDFGFSVSLDLWNRSEINALGPVPWLHSCLEAVRRCGGKAVMVLTPDACERAKQWGCPGAKREPEEVQMCSEVFDATLSCILGDYLLGRAGERFALAQFDGRCIATALPEFFRGLPLFSLPSQSLDFITELTKGARTGGKVSERWERAGARRAASRALYGMLTEITGTGLSQDSEKGWETVPLQAKLSSPALHTNISTADGV
ncbi:interleukin-17 receptor C [Pseudorasbora parva]|uniref:interleukin-17 receptor C n=1 Tax=Pseudorasbora parva TaxID=51549 RepID=UPI00351E4D5B